MYSMYFAPVGKENKKSKLNLSKKERDILQTYSKSGGLNTVESSMCCRACVLHC